MLLFCSASSAQDRAAVAPMLPELGDSSTTALSPQLERRIGVEIMRGIRRDPAYVDDAEVIEYLNVLGMSLVNVSNASSVDFEFFLIADPAINAFAMPGGFVGVHSGLILAAQTESELASVLAHEISHVVQHHIARGRGKQGQLSVVNIAGMLIGMLAARNSAQAGQAIAMASQAGTLQAQLAYTREFEREADRVGIEILQRAGYDVTGMVGFFERLQKATRLYENNAPAYLQTHPLTVERLSDMQNRIQVGTYRQRLDRVDFQLIRAKLRAEQGSGADAASFFEQQIKERRYSSEGASMYGLAYSYLRTRNYEQAGIQLNLANKVLGPHGMLDLLRGRIQWESGARRDALQTYESAIARQPGYRPLQYAHVQALQRMGEHERTLVILRELIRRYPQDGKLYSLQAASFAATNRALLQHQAQAEAYFLQGSTQAAIEQLQIAMKAGDGNFYQLSSVEARLRELKAKLMEESRAR